MPYYKESGHKCGLLQVDPICLFATTSRQKYCFWLLVNAFKII